jgi:hypothetical protein
MRSRCSRCLPDELCLCTPLVPVWITCRPRALVCWGALEHCLSSTGPQKKNHLRPRDPPEFGSHRDQKTRRRPSAAIAKSPSSPPAVASPRTHPVRPLTPGLWPSRRLHQTDTRFLHPRQDEKTTTCPPSAVIRTRPQPKALLPPPRRRRRRRPGQVRVSCTPRQNAKTTTRPTQRRQPRRQP